MLHAITRRVSDAIGSCQLSHLERRPIDLALARRQHAEYEALLGELGCKVLSHAADPELPDSVFVEDTAVVLPDLAVIARPGAESRRPETAAVAEILRSHRDLHFIRAPGTLDGGDVLQIGDTMFVGRSERSNRHGRGQLSEIVTAHGYRVIEVEIRGCLHLKSAVTAVGPGTLLINPEMTAVPWFSDFRMIEVDPNEPLAANALAVGATVVLPAHHPLTACRLEDAGLDVRPVAASELAKAEGGVTCCSLLFEG